MSLLDGLVFYAAMANNAPPFTQTDYVNGNNLLAPNGLTSVQGQSGLAVELDKTQKQYLMHADAAAFRVGSHSFSVSVWVKLNTLNSADGAYTIAGKQGEWQMYLFWAGQWVWHGEISVHDPTNPGGSSGVTEENVFGAVVDKWYLVTMTWDAGGNITLSVNGNAESNSEIWIPDSGNKDFRVGAQGTGLITTYPFDGDIQNLGIWDRVLSNDEIEEIYQGAVWPFADPVDPCDAVSCCEDTTPVYDASNPTPSGLANTANQCVPVPIVTIDPPGGTTTTFPTLVFLHCNRSDATIYYTLDGSQPTINSSVYSTPLTITGQQQIVSAMAVIPNTNCLPGPTVSAQYVAYASDFTFAYSCDTTDLVGQWGDFLPNGVADYHWKLRLGLAASTDIQRIELYQVNAAGVWDSGQAWATAEFINPIEGPTGFHVFPLGVFDDGLTPNVAYATTRELQVAYTNDFGTFAANTYLWTLVGQPVHPLYGYFKLIVFMGDGRRLESIIATTCGDPPPPPCPTPTTPTLATSCVGNNLGVDITFTETAGKSFRIYKGTVPTISPPFTLLTSGVVASNPQTIHDSDVLPGKQYCYYISVDEDPVQAGCGWQDSGHACISTPPAPSGTILADGVSVETVSAGANIVLTWTCANATGNISILANSACGGLRTLFTGACAGTGTVTDDNIQCDTQYIISVPGQCSTIFATMAIVNVLVPPSCNVGSMDQIIAIDPGGSNPWSASHFFSDGGTCFFGPVPGPFPGWNGQMRASNVSGNCQWNAGDGGFFPSNVQIEGGSPLHLAQVQFDGLQWTLFIQLVANSKVVWYGVKAFGADDPTGLYTQDLGFPQCASGPTTINVVKIA